MIRQSVGKDLSKSEVACEHDINRYLFDAKSRVHPFDKPDKEIPPDLRSAIDLVCEMEGDIIEWRASQIEMLRSVSQQVHDLGVAGQTAPAC